MQHHKKDIVNVYPRLELLREMLAEDGNTWISIDDREYASLKCIGDEIWGVDCFVSNISWQRTYSTRNDSKSIINKVEHILVYGKKPDWQPNKLPRIAEMNKKYKILTMMLWASSFDRYRKKYFECRESALLE